MLTEFCQENALVIANTLFQQHNRRLYRWTSPDGHTKTRLIIFFAAINWEALYSQQKRDWELTVAQITNSSLQKETTWPFRYDLYQTPYDYTVEVTNRFNILDLIDRIPEELWTEVHDIVQEAVIKTIPKKKKWKKAKWLSEEAI